MVAPPGGYQLALSEQAIEQRAALENSDPRRFKKVQKALRFLKQNPAHPGLRAHKFNPLRGQAPGGGDIWEAYVENDVASAWRIFFYFDRAKPGVIFVASIEPHP